LALAFVESVGGHGHDEFVAQRFDAVDQIEVTDVEQIERAVGYEGFGHCWFGYGVVRLCRCYWTGSQIKVGMTSCRVRSLAEPWPAIAMCARTDGDRVAVRLRLASRLRIGRVWMARLVLLSALGNHAGS